MNTDLSVRELTTELRQQLAAERDPGRRISLIDDALRPAEPQLLDTCVLQNLDWIDRQLEPTGSVVWDETATAALVRRFGTELAEDLLDLGTLYKRFEYESGGYPWLVCLAAVDEAQLLRGPKGRRLKELIDFLIGHQDEWCSDTYPGIAPGALLAKGSVRVSPLILRALGVTTVTELQARNGPLSFLPDQGDRLVAAHALLSNIPVVLTTDRRTFWAHRAKLADWGVAVMRPSDILPQYETYWTVLESEFERRRQA